MPMPLTRSTTASSPHGKSCASSFTSQHNSFPTVPALTSQPPVPLPPSSFRSQRTTSVRNAQGGRDVPGQRGRSSTRETMAYLHRHQVAVAATAEMEVEMVATARFASNERRRRPRASNKSWRRPRAGNTRKRHLRHAAQQKQPPANSARTPPHRSGYMSKPARGSGSKRSSCCARRKRRAEHNSMRN